MAKGKLAISLERLSKHYGSVRAVDGISLSVRQGEVFALLGPNGAGKTTTIAMLCGLLAPTSGSASVAGFDVARERLSVRKSIGVVFQQPSVDDLLSGRENLRMHALLYGIAPSQVEKRIDEMLGIVGLKGRADSLVREYSGGMRRRLEIARGLMHRPAVLFLDEPTTGLDPQSRQHIWRHIRETSKREGNTVIFTTHYLEEAEKFADRVAIIDRGKVLAVGTPSGLVGTLGGDELIFTSKSPRKLSGALRKSGLVKNVKAEGSVVRASIAQPQKNLPRLLRKLPAVESLEVRKATLDEVFIQKTGREIRQDAAEGSFWQRIMDNRANR